MQTKSIQPVGRHYLLVIAIDAYHNYDLLDNCVSDAEDLMDVLIENYQFDDDNLILLDNEDATKQKIFNCFKFLTKELEEEDSLVIFFTGHGHYDYDLQKGYWIPVEAKCDYASDYISNDEIVSYIKAMNARHILLLVDACFSGSLLYETTKSIRFFDEVYKVPSRWALAAGGIETVEDGIGDENSPFIDALLTILKNNTKPYLHIKDIINYVEQNVTNNNEQRPLGKPIKNVGHKEGQFIFFRKELNNIVEQPINSEEMIGKEIIYDIPYAPVSEICEKIKGKFDDYFDKIFEVDIQKTPSSDEIKSVQTVINQWEEDIKKYCKTHQKHFGLKKFPIYRRHPQGFKSKVFKLHLWTVNSALTTPDLELLRYKKAFAGVNPKELTTKVKYIIDKTEEYISTSMSGIDFHTIKHPDELKQAFFDEDDMFLSGVIGFGIRSELLHKLYPATLSIMTRKNHWGMYFLTSDFDFLTVEVKNFNGQKKTRYTNQFKYNYPRFNFYSNYLILLLEKRLKTYGISIDNSIRFGYSNSFLAEVNEFNKETRKTLFTWQ